MICHFLFIYSFPTSQTEILSPFPAQQLDRPQQTNPSIFSIYGRHSKFSTLPNTFVKNQSIKGSSHRKKESIEGGLDGRGLKLKAHVKN